MQEDDVTDWFVVKATISPNQLKDSVGQEVRHVSHEAAKKVLQVMLGRSQHWRYYQEEAR
jgi:hypothetical protein